MDVFCRSCGQGQGKPRPYLPTAGRYQCHWGEVDFSCRPVKAVIPAKAGIQSADSAFPKGCTVDSRFRGNDYGLRPPCLASDTARKAILGHFGVALEPVFPYS